MNFEVGNDDIVLDLVDLLMALYRKLFWIIASGIVVAVLAFGYTKLFIVPMYSSTTKIYILSDENEKNSVLTYSDVQTVTLLTKDYKEMIKSRPVMEAVVEKLGLTISADELLGKVRIEEVAETRILYIHAEDEDPVMAKKIADGVREASIEQVAQIMEKYAIKTVEEGNIPQAPYAPNVMRNTVLGGMIGIVLAVVVIAILYISDDSLKSVDDVERYLGMNVLVMIPMWEKQKKTKGFRRWKQKRRKIR